MKTIIMSIHISGIWNGEENSITELNFPEEYNRSKRETHCLSGNDDFLLLTDKESSSFWKLKLDDLKLWNWIKISNFITTESQPKRKKTKCSIKKVICGDITSVCLTNSGLVYEIPNKIDTRACIGTICDIECGYEHTIALTDRGRVYTWGNGRRCQLGHGDLNNLEEPTEVNALAGISIIKIRAGGWHSIALSDSGDLYTWGWNDTGQLGIHENDGRTLASYSIPTLVDFYDDLGNVLEINIKDAACGSRHSAVLSSDNALWTTGLNKYGQLGLCIDTTPSLKCYKKVFECKQNCSVLCGPWSTAVVLN